MSAFPSEALFPNWPTQLSVCGPLSRVNNQQKAPQIRIWFPQLPFCYLSLFIRQISVIFPQEMDTSHPQYWRTMSEGSVIIRVCDVTDFGQILRFLRAKSDSGEVWRSADRVTLDVCLFALKFWVVYFSFCKHCPCIGFWNLWLFVSQSGPQFNWWRHTGCGRMARHPSKQQ